MPESRRRSVDRITLGLDRGETAAILLVAESFRADLILIDERIGRKVVRERGLAVRGTLGMLVEARQRGWIPALRPARDALVAEGFRIAPAYARRWRTSAKAGSLEP